MRVLIACEFSGAVKNKAIIGARRERVKTILLRYLLILLVLGCAGCKGGKDTLPLKDIFYLITLQLSVNDSVKCPAEIGGEYMIVKSILRHDDIGVLNYCHEISEINNGDRIKIIINKPDEVKMNHMSLFGYNMDTSEIVKVVGDTIVAIDNCYAQIYLDSERFLISPKRDFENEDDYLIYKGKRNNRKIFINGRYEFSTKRILREAIRL